MPHIGECALFKLRHVVSARAHMSESTMLLAVDTLLFYLVKECLSVGLCVSSPSWHHILLVLILIDALTTINFLGERAAGCPMR